MKMIRYIIYMVFFMTGLSSCVMEDVLEPSETVNGIEEALPDDMYFILEPPTPHTRVIYTNEYKSLFEREDIVGCFAVRKSTMELMPENEGYKRNATYRVAVHTNVETDEERYFLAPMTVSDNLPRTDDIMYLFYYPYDKTLDEVSSLTELKNYSHTVREDQNNRDYYEASDMMWDFCEPDHERNCVYVRMDHAMANIIVEVSPDLIDVDYTIPVPVLQNLATTANGIDLTSTSSEQMDPYDTDNAGQVAMWEFGKANSGNYMFRATVPAFQTIEVSQVLLQIQAPDHVKHNYRCQKTITLQPGMNYFFHAKMPDPEDDVDDGQVVAPEVTDDDTWVYDVLDPDTHQPVGLLCKEYLYFQPGHSASVADQKTGTSYTNGSQSTKYLSSQAWVFYKNRPSGEPDLDVGYVMRFEADIRYKGDGETSGYWPLPHNSITDTGSGLFTPDHGHSWVSSDGGSDWRIKDGLHGKSSDDFVEYYMHGGKVIWDGTGNRIQWFEMPAEQHTNAQAEHAHIAIDPNGDTYICYNDITIDSPHKMAILIPHYLVDRRVSGNRSVNERLYPLVKIGYNDFWMSLALRAATKVDGTPITNYNTKGSPGVSLPSSLADRNAGYIYSSKADASGLGFTDYDPYNQYTVEKRDTLQISPMYNFMALEGAGMVPASAYAHAEYYMPGRQDVMRMMEYLGWHAGAKLMTRGVRTRDKVKVPADPNFAESEYEALLHGKYTTGGANQYGANICGFDLRAEGYCEGGLKLMGEVGGILLRENDPDGNGPKTGCYIYSLPYYLLFSNEDPSTFINKNDVFREQWNDGPSSSFATIRFFLKFHGQADNSSGGLSLMGLGQSLTKAPSEKVVSRDVYVGLEAAAE